MAFGVYSPVVNVELKVTTARVYSIELPSKESLRLVKKNGIFAVACQIFFPRAKFHSLKLEKLTSNFCIV